MKTRAIHQSRRAVMLSALALMGAGLYWLPGPVRAHAQVGQTATVFAGTDSQGKVHRLADYHEELVERACSSF